MSQRYTTTFCMQPMYVKENYILPVTFIYTEITSIIRTLIHTKYTGYLYTRKYRNYEHETTRTNTTQYLRNHSLTVQYLRNHNLYRNVSSMS